MQLAKKAYLIDQYFMGKSEDDTDLSITTMRSDLSIGRMFHVAFTYENSLIGLCKSQRLLDEAIERLPMIDANDNKLDVYFPLVLFWTHYFIAAKSSTLQSCVAVGIIPHHGHYGLYTMLLSMYIKVLRALIWGDLFTPRMCWIRNILEGQTARK